MKEQTQDNNLTSRPSEAGETLEDITARREESATSPNDSDATPAPEKSVYDKVALMAMIVSLIAWAVMLVPSLYSGYVALAVAVISVVLSAFGLKSRRRIWRDTATTAPIIGGVLAVVILSFIVVIYVGLKGM